MNDTFLGPNRERDRRPIRFLIFGIVTILLFGLLTTRLAYLQINSGPQLRGPRGSPAHRRAGDPGDARPHLRSQGPPPGQQRRDLGREDHAVRPPVRRARRGGRAARGPAGDRAVGDRSTTLDSAPGSRFDPVRIAQDVPEDTARLVADPQTDLPGVHVVVETRREYPDGPLLSAHPRLYRPHRRRHVRAPAPEGYLADDLIGKTGVEATFEAELRGTYGTELVEKDATGRTPGPRRRCQDAVPGASLTLTIDRTIQQRGDRRRSSGA